ncbi:aromatic hydrocarbon degradation protein [Aliivibrio fischeri]|uniref:outer membrane protein transport protein n=1 Tax=Aliivibrio fischeri TaxID=668 RepID=UPI0012D86432|nr:OmpP1/FadL family transporter [Aliivibrio fischeri]MUK61055.1 aromatic hydrocarbon degradation protein [Aliivibrio fischeri]MUK68539.1 aromatic hydrocarbon degradation protein [Aliivibrio fischeri]MUK73161.1 aromatic hydrocarbon degradation protein [Aliivibrio fischeri]MUK76066.1 aromatic hydrocarbon degradation protein [Aliivibrio fischeri]MUL20923.1 aromatic hydrocarbon degradation protein [Aliivibrio fischeri]
MNKKRLFSKTLLAATITLATQQATAAGFQLNAQSATGLGRAFAGDAVIADNASVMSRNAAAMALFDSSQFSAGLNYIDTDIEVSDVKYLGQDVDDANNGSGTPVPNIYYIHRLNDKWAFGAGIYSNFGTENNFDNSFGQGSGGGVAPDATVFGGTTEIKSVNFALTTSYRINEQWSVGGGIDVIYGSGTLKREAVVTHPVAGELLRQSLVDIDATGTGVGFNLGTVYELNERNRFGFSYHYSPEIEAEDGNQKVTLPLPDMLEFSGYHEIKDTKFAVHYSVQYIGWSDFDKIEFTNNPSGLSESVYDWQNGMHYAIGGTYFLNDAWTLRAGYMYDTAAQDELTSISVPDSDRQWFSAGFSYHFEKKHTIDFGFTYLMGDDVDVTENAAPGVDLTATTHADAILAGVQYSYSF